MAKKTKYVVVKQRGGCMGCLTWVFIILLILYFIGKFG